jgi:hypothetical protein
VLRGEHLQLQRQGEAIAWPARAEADEALASLEHGARRHRLEAIEVGQAIGIGLVGPGEPQALDPVLERAVLDQRGRLDAAAHGMRCETRRGIGGVGIRAHQLPGARPRSSSGSTGPAQASQAARSIQRSACSVHSFRCMRRKAFWAPGSAIAFSALRARWSALTESLQFGGLAADLRVRSSSRHPRTGISDFSPLDAKHNLSWDGTDLSFKPSTSARTPRLVRQSKTRRSLRRPMTLMKVGCTSRILCL